MAAGAGAAAPPSTGSGKSGRASIAMERTGQWVFSQEVPTDIVVEVGEASFALHKFMLMAKSGLVRKMIMESPSAELSRINLSEVTGGAEIFEKAAKFCYGVNFEITVHNVAALRCAADYLEMTERYCDENLADRTEDFLACAALTTLSGAVAVLKSCESLLPIADHLNLVKRCVDVVSTKACNEANFPSRSPPDWWAAELAALNISSFQKVIATMKSRGAKAPALASAIIAYTDKSLRDLVRDQSGAGSATAALPADATVRKIQRQVLEAIVALLPPVDKSSFSGGTALPISFLSCLLRAAIFLNVSVPCKNELERRVSAVLEHVMVGDLLVLSFTYDGERLFDLDSVRRIIAVFVEREQGARVYGSAPASAAMQRVARTVDAYLAEIATDGELSISKFTGIAYLIPKTARKVDDDLYRAVDIYLKTHPGLDEIEREKVCSVMDPLKLSYEARVHASQNKRLPVQIVLHALYYDQLKLRSGVVDDGLGTPDALATRAQIQADSTLIKENEMLRSELAKMKICLSDLQRSHGSSARSSSSKRPTFFSSVSKTLGKLNPFKHGSKDTSHLDDGMEVVEKPRRRRFSIS